MNRLLQNAFDQAHAQAEEKFEERLKALEANREERRLKETEDTSRLTKKFDDEVLEMQRAFEESRGAKVNLL